MKKHNFKYYLAASVSLITFLVYLSALQNEFVEWDDPDYASENPYIRSFGLTFFRWAFFDFYAANWHPLTWISHALDYAVWGLNPLGHHLTNNILHAVNTFIVVLLVARLMKAAKAPIPSSPPVLGGVSEGRGGNRNEVLLPDKPPLPLLNQGGELKGRAILIAAATTGLLFGLHPIHVESVAWVSERKDLLCALFYLLSILKYMSYRTYKTYTAYLLSLLFFTLALLSKPMAVSLPLVLLILDWFPFNRVHSLKTFRTALVGKIPFIALSVVSSIVTLMAQKAGEAMQLMEVVPFSTRALVAAKALSSYLRKMLLPLELIPYYPYPHDASLLSPVYLLPVLLATGTTILCLVIARKQKLWLSVWGYYVLTLVPVIGLVQVGGQAMADRYTYLPSLGPFLLLGLGGAWLSTKGPALKDRGESLKLAPAAAAVFVFGALTFLTVNQIGIWKTSLDLWSYVIEKQPAGVPIAYNNRGIAYVDMGRLDKALVDLNKAIALNPTDHAAHNNRGFVFNKLGRFDEAFADYAQAIALKPGYFKAYNNRGSAFEKIGRLDRAFADYDRAIALNPRYSEAYANKGIAYGKAGLFDNSIEFLNKALEINPNYVDAYVSRGISYARIGQSDRAFDDFNKAIRFNQNHILAYFNRGDLYRKTGDRGLAMSDFQKACDLGDKEGCEALQALQTTDK